MPRLKKRLISGVLGLTLILTLPACDSDDPSDTTSPVGSTSTAPVGS